MMSRGNMGKEISSAGKGGRASRVGGTMNRIQPMPPGSPPRGGMLGGRGNPVAAVGGVQPNPADFQEQIASMQSKLPGRGDGAMNRRQPMPVRGMAKGGKVTRGDGMCKKGHTKGKMY